MMNVIKTAIITIIISIISGLLVEYFKNLAPRILCEIGNGVPMKMGDKKVYAYVITVSNLSKKIIHELSLNVQSLQSNLKIADAKITKGLKFESSLKDNILDIDIPFLSKGDEFSIKLYLESRKKPVIVMRSPENFKQIDSIQQNGILSSSFSKTNKANKNAGRSVKNNERIVPNEKDDYTMIMNKPLKAEKNINKGILNFGKNKKIIIATASVILLILAGILVKFYFTGAPTKTQVPTAKANTNKKPTDAAQSPNKTNKDPSAKLSDDKKTENAGSGASQSKTNQNSSSNESQSGENQNSKAATGGTTSNLATPQDKANESAKPKADEANKSSDTKATTNEASGTSNANSSSTGTTGNNNASTQTNGTGENTGK